MNPFIAKDNQRAPAIITQFTGPETFYRYEFAGDILFTEGIKYVADAAGVYGCSI
jgi:hypothetical protein